MSPESLVLGLALFGVLAVVIAWPWLQTTSSPSPRRSGRSGEEQHPAQPSVAPQQEYQALVAAIRDLDFDHRIGIVTEEDYRPLRDALALRAASLLQELDYRSRQESDLDAQIEAMVSALRSQGPRTPVVHPKDVGATTCPACGCPVQAGDRFCAHCGTALQRICPHCGVTVAPQGRFCPGCGRPLTQEVTETP